MADSATLRQQYRSKLEDSLGQMRGVLGEYQQAYPDLFQQDPGGVQQALATQPATGVNVHAEPQGLRPSYIAEQTIEPVEFGSAADPVSQLAFLAVPGPLTGAARALDATLSPAASVAVKVPLWALKHIQGVLQAGPSSLPSEGLP